LQEHFRRNEARIKNDFKGKITMLQNFLKEINEKHDLTLSSLGKDKLVQKLRALHTANEKRKEQPVNYIKHKGKRFFEVVDEYKSQKS